MNGRIGREGEAAIEDCREDRASVGGVEAGGVEAGDEGG